MSGWPPRRHCQSAYAHEDGALLVCPKCVHEWSAAGDTETGGASGDAALVVEDAHGAVLSDGDAVVSIKHLKIKGRLWW